MRCACAAGMLTLALAFASAPVRAQSSAESRRVEGEPTHASNLRDREFGVATRQFGLQRRVEMYQWRRGDDGRYRKVWWDRPVDSSAHEAAYRNPGTFPLPTRYWISESATLDGKPLDDEVLKTLGTWRAFRPGFTSLPGNLAATFQPEGDGLVSAENPLDPQVEDLRVTWRELVLPELDGRLVLRGGVWMLQAQPRSAAMVDQAPSHEPKVATNEQMRWLERIAIGFALLAAVLGAFLFRQRVRLERRNTSDLRRNES